MCKKGWRMHTYCFGCNLLNNCPRARDHSARAHPPEYDIASLYMVSFYCFVTKACAPIHCVCRAHSVCSLDYCSQAITSIRTKPTPREIDLEEDAKAAAIEGILVRWHYAGLVWPPSGCVAVRLRDTDSNELTKAEFVHALLSQ